MKLTEKSVAKLTTTGKESIVWDDAMPGFGVRVKPGGGKSYVVQYRHGKVSKRMTIGSCSVFKLEQARERARKLLSAAKDGGDPATERRH